MPWLLRDGDVLATVEGHRALGAALTGAVVLRGPVLVQTLTPCVALDVAWCGDVTGDDGRSCLQVRRISRLPRRRLARPQLRGGAVVVAGQGSFERWGLHVGDRLELR